MSTSSDPTDLFVGLKALSDASFPKQCASCGRHYASAEDFIAQTEALRDGVSGLKSSLDEKDKPIVELFRNCLCGSTLMDCFDDRRDLSEPGLKRRKLFGQLLKMLEGKGIGPEMARVELLKILRGEHSPALSEIGIKTKSL